MSSVLYCKTRLSINGQSPFYCMPITAKNALYLDSKGPASREKGDVVLQLNEHKELVILNLSSKAVFLERAGRRCRLVYGHPVRICEKDIIDIENASLCLVESTFIAEQPAVPVPISSRSFWMASAALCSVVALSACQSAGHSANSANDVPVQCEENATRCIGDDIHVCQNNAWVRLMSCKADEVCIELSNTSAECHPNRLTGDVAPIQEMENSFLADDTCENNDETKCVDNVIYVCKDNKWELSEDCHYNDDPERKDAFYCAKKMEGLKGYCDSRRSGPEICNQLDDTYMCIPKSSMCQGATCNVTPGPTENPCTEGGKLCFNNSVYVCENKRWVQAEICEAPSTCNEYIKIEPSDSATTSKYSYSPHCKDKEPCEENNEICYQESIYKCQDQKWVLNRSCKDGFVCSRLSNGAATCGYGPTAGIPAIGSECEFGQTKCDAENAILKCSSQGFWKYEKICESPQVCVHEADSEAVCGEKKEP